MHLAPLTPAHGRPVTQIPFTYLRSLTHASLEGRTVIGRLMLQVCARITLQITAWMRASYCGMSPKVSSVIALTSSGYAWHKGRQHVTRAEHSQNTEFTPSCHVQAISWLGKVRHGSTWSTLGSYRKQIPLTQWRSLVGVGKPSFLNTWPKCPLHWAHTISIRLPSGSGRSSTAPGTPAGVARVRRSYESGASKSGEVSGVVCAAARHRRRRASHSRC